MPRNHALGGLPRCWCCVCSCPTVLVFVMLLNGEGGGREECGVMAHRLGRGCLAGETWMIIPTIIITPPTTPSFPPPHLEDWIMDPDGPQPLHLTNEDTKEEPEPSLPLFPHTKLVQALKHRVLRAQCSSVPDHRKIPTYTSIAPQYLHEAFTHSVH